MYSIKSLNRFQPDHCLLAMTHANCENFKHTMVQAWIQTLAWIIAIAISISQLPYPAPCRIANKAALRNSFCETPP